MITIYFAGLDLGSTMTRVVIIDENGEWKTSTIFYIQQLYGQPLSYLVDHTPSFTMGITV